MITVFTPTYNRLYIIEKLYNSLLNQTHKNFEWLVIDDGSTDGTEAYFEDIIKKDNPFPIRYFKQENGGKHRAINKGVALAQGELFFIVDSDDSLTENAIQKLYEWKSTLEAGKLWAGVSGAKGYTESKLVGECNIDKPYIDAKNTEREKYKLTGDKAEAYFTDVLKKYPFPEFEGENFITEEVVWNAIAMDGYQIRWFKDIIYLCNYLEDGLTRNISKKYIENPQGVLYWAKLQKKAFKSNIRKKYSAIYRYYSCVKSKKSKKQIAADLEISKFELTLTLLARKIFGRKSN